MLPLLLLLLLPLFSSSAALDFLSGGFLHAKIGGESSQTFLIDEFNSVPLSLDKFHFSSLPSYLDLKSSSFRLFEGKRVNDRNVYFNGRNFLFFMKNVEPYGTWLLGDTPGVDSGVGYIRPQSHSLVPLDLESSKNKWNFLIDGKWKVEDNVLLTSLQEESSQNINRMQFNSVSYFLNGGLASSIILMNKFPGNRKDIEGDAGVFSFSQSLSMSLPPDSLDEKYPVYWDINAKQWTPLLVSFVIPKGYPVRLHYSRSVKEEKAKNASSQVVHLVAHEAHDRNWRLFFREMDRDNGNDLEVKVYIDQSGLESQYKVKSLKKNAANSYTAKLTDKTRKAEVGSFFWLLFQVDPSTLGENKYQALSENNFLLKCISKSSNDNNLVFQYYHSHRRVAMDRSLLSLATSMISASFNEDIGAYEWSLDGAPLIAQALFALAPDPISWLRNYLISHENFLSPGLSSCFMYHGGVSMPEQLIYAAELMCVLIGSKPMTMIQYTSSSDHQWKFPLLPELTQMIIAGHHIYGSLLADVGLQVNKYQISSETLIFYRKGHKDALDLIVPNGTAQALHIVPFPAEAGDDEAKMNVVLREQIYNSYWNGIVLGYPSRFVESYLKTFHTNLDQVSVLEEMERGKRDVRHHFEQNPELRLPEIKYGSDDDLLGNQELLSYFISML